jgi:hypothetical protein
MRLKHCSLRQLSLESGCNELCSGPNEIGAVAAKERVRLTKAAPFVMICTVSVTFFASFDVLNARWGRLTSVDPERDTHRVIGLSL